MSIMAILLSVPQDSEKETTRRQVIPISTLSYLSRLTCSRHMRPPVSGIWNASPPNSDPSPVQRLQSGEAGNSLLFGTCRECQLSYSSAGGGGYGIAVRRGGRRTWNSSPQSVVGMLFPSNVLVPLHTRPDTGSGLFVERTGLSDSYVEHWITTLPSERYIGSFITNPPCRPYGTTSCYQLVCVIYVYTGVVVLGGERVVVWVWMRYAE